ncbi:flavin carrier protein 2 [Aspergillus udagawae]|nr:flavin carrier protein 2 [Aspergillus udagawae]
MLSTFPCIRFGLLIGIAGGIPSENADIRLGDVVVSTPTTTHAGVVQYDYGKAYPEHFQRTGMLNKPPEILLTAVSKLRSKHLREKGMIQQFLSQMIDKNPHMSQEFGFGGRQDHLFRADYRHLESEATCDKCDRSQLVPRKQRTSNLPKIHYGLIASANQVMKDAASRDKLGRELGAYCVDMEAAGLMDHFPCLVVRGICDYADSHKNKEWQGYAAATAAAYTKELLMGIPEEEAIQKCEGSLEDTYLPRIGSEHRELLRTEGAYISSATGSEGQMINPVAPQETGQIFLQPTSTRHSQAFSASSRLSPCDPTCGCICHKIRTRRTWGILRPLQKWVGRLYIVTSRSPDTSYCQYHCRNGGQRIVEIHYSCPDWFWQATIHALLRKSPLGSPSFGLAFRRRVGYWEEHSITRLVDERDIITMQTLLGQGKIFIDDLEPEHGGTALQRAIQLQDIDLIEFLIHQGADPDIADDLGTSARDEATFSFLACSHNEIYWEWHENRLQSIISIGSHLDEWNLSYLHKIILKIHLTDLREALQDRTIYSQLESQDQQGRTPLHWAAIRADADAVRILINAKANVNTRDNYHKTPLHFASETSSFECFELLLKTKSCPTARTLIGEEPIHKICRSQADPIFLIKLLEFDVDVNSRAGGIDGVTPVTSAISGCRPGILDELIRQNADLSMADREGDTALFEAVACDSSECLKVLLQNQASADILHVNKRGMTVLHMAALYPSLEILEILADADLYGLDPDAKDNEGCTAQDRFSANACGDLRKAFDKVLGNLHSAMHAVDDSAQGNRDQFPDCDD